MNTASPEAEQAQRGGDGCAGDEIDLSGQGDPFDLPPYAQNRQRRSIRKEADRSHPSKESIATHVELGCAFGTEENE